jgi:ligand-binding sensor domain-containing protein
MRLITLLLFVIILSTLPSCNGQDNTENKETQNNSYPEGKLVSELDEKIWVVYQDIKGNYWFGSNGNGVFLYDGKQLIQFTKKDGLIDNTIRGIQGDNSGNVFIETPEGISKYDLSAGQAGGNTFTNLKPISSASNEWKSEPNDLWFYYNANDVYRYDGESLFELTLPRMNLEEAFGTEVKGVPFKGMNNSPYAVYGIDKDKKGNLWFGTVTAGVFRYDGESFLWIAEKELSTLPDGRVPGVRSMIEDKDGNFWLSNFISKYRISDEDSVAYYEKLKGVDMSEGQFQNRIPYFNSGLSDNKGNLWMTTYTGGVWKYDGEELLNFQITDGKTEVLLISIYQDNEGIFWLGTDNAGVYKFDGETFGKFEPMENKRTDEPNRLPDDTSMKVNETSKQNADVPWVDPLFYIDGQLCQHVRKIFQDTKGNIWFGTNVYDLMRYNGETLEHFDENDGIGGGRITGIVEDAEGNVWFGTYKGLTKYDLSAEQAGGKSFTNFNENNGLLNNEIWSLIIDSKGGFWIGTNEGVCHFDGKEFTTFPIPKARVQDTTTIYAYDRITCIMEESNGTIWFGTDGFGICKYDGENFSQVTIENGLPDNNISDIMEDSKGNIWIGTVFGGLSRYDSKTFSNFTEDGIISGIEVGGLFEDKTGNIWFAAENHGVYRYDGKSFTNFTEEDGLNTNGILSIFEDREGRFWFGGWGGLFRYDGKSFFSVTKNGPWE